MYDQSHLDLEDFISSIHVYYVYYRIQTTYRYTRSEKRFTPCKKIRVVLGDSVHNRSRVKTYVSFCYQTFIERSS